MKLVLVVNIADILLRQQSINDNQSFQNTEQQYFFGGGGLKLKNQE
jgi:hypothetical protein